MFLSFLRWKKYSESDPNNIIIVGFTILFGMIFLNFMVVVNVLGMNGHELNLKSV